MKKISIFILTAFLMLNFTLNTYAAENTSIIRAMTNGVNISAYINTETADCSAMLGTTPCKIISYDKTEDLPSDTLILVDTSGSIPKVVQDKTSEFLSLLIDGKIENERYAIASFGTDISYLCDYTSDRYELSKAVEKLDYSEKYTYIYSTLDDALKNIGNNVFTKIIIISDGVENSKDGITYDEILKSVSDSHCPVYTIGIENSNQEYLKKFYSFSRNSAAKSFTLTSDTDVSEVCGVVNECRNYTCLTIDIPDALTDGSIKYLQISGENFECGIDIRMPVAEITETEILEAVSETTTANAEPEQTREKSTLDIKIIIAIVAVTAIILVIIAVIFKSIDRKEKAHEKSAAPVDQSSIETIIKKQIPGGDDTIIDDCIIMLTDVNVPEHSFRSALGDGVIVGRNAKECMIAIDYDKHISRSHCRIYREKDKILIENLSTKQGVTINGKYVIERAGSPEKISGGKSTGTKILLPNVNSSVRELSSGDLIRIGHTTLRFEIK